MHMMVRILKENLQIIRRSRSVLKCTGVWKSFLLAEEGGGLLRPGVGLLGSIFAGYVLLASQNPNPVIVYSVGTGAYYPEPPSPILFLWANPVPYLFIFRSTSHGGFRGCFCNNQSRESCGHPLFTSDRQPKLFTFTWPPRLQAQAHVFCSPPYSAAFRPILMLVNLLRV